jgi:transcriptional regulator with XRE-family HTH domain
LVKRKRRLVGPLNERLALLRKESDLTQAELAAKLDVDKTAISHWETGASRPDLSRLFAIATEFDVTVDELLGEKKAS